MPYPNEFSVNRIKTGIGIAILAKAPIPGLAKTRLIPRLGADGAALLQRWLLQRTMTTAFSADTGPVSLWCAPDERHPDFATCRAYGPVTLNAQPEGDLGLRMLTALQANTGLQGTLVIGTDCAVLTPAVVRSAAHALLTHDAVVIPAEDGGYVLIGMRKPEARVFEHMAWSTSTVMAETRNRFAALGWSVKELPTLWDIDVPDDVDRLCALCPEAGKLEKPSTFSDPVAYR
jgi:uncharacterized protein